MQKIPKSILRNLLILLLSLAVAASTYTARHNGARALGEQEAADRYTQILLDEDYTKDLENTEDAVDELVETYHETVNDLFNRKIKAMAELAASEKPEDMEILFKSLSPPKPTFDENQQITGREPCGEGDISTYCLAQGALKEYFAFRLAMMKARNVTQEKVMARQAVKKVTEAGDGEVVVIGGKQTLEESTKDQGDILGRIDREIDISRKTLDRALATYSEMQMALPLHHKYKKVITALEKYRSQLGKLRRTIDLYPVIFFNITTTKCT